MSREVEVTLTGSLPGGVRHLLLPHLSIEVLHGHKGLLCMLVLLLGLRYGEGVKFSKFLHERHVYTNRIF